MAAERTFVVEQEKQVEFLCGFLRRQVVPFQAIVGSVRKQRSLTQNNRLWALHTLAGEVTGYTPDEIHEEALCKHFGYTEQERKDLFTGEITMKRIPLKRSSQREKAEFAKFMDATEMWYGSEFGVWLPPME